MWMISLTILSGQQCKFIIICILFSVFVTTKVIERNTLLRVICIRWPTMNKTFYTYLNALVKKAFISFLVQPAPSNPLRKFSIQSWWVRVYLFIYQFSDMASFSAIHVYHYRLQVLFDFPHWNYYLVDCRCILSDSLFSINHTSWTERALKQHPLWSSCRLHRHVDNVD